MKVKTLEYKESSGIVFTEPSRTKQADMEKCDLQYQLARFSKTGVMGNLRSDEPLTGDFSDIPNLIDAQNRLIDLQVQFDALPAKLRNKFDNDPLQMIEWLQKDENREEAIKYGLLVDKDSESVLRDTTANGSSVSVPPSPDTGGTKDSSVKAQ